MQNFFDQNLRQRVLTALIAGPIALALILYSWQTTAVLVAILLLLGAYEYIHITQAAPSSILVDIIFGILYLGIPLVAIIWLRRYEPDGLKYLVLALLTNWLVDSTALFGGKLYGKRKFAPVISPKKTWEGVYTGVAAGTVGVFVFALLLDLPIDIITVLFALILPVATIEGDLLESRLKRRFGVKDSGKLFPGHGGVLDRIDSPIFTIPIAALIVMLLG